MDVSGNRLSDLTGKAWRTVKRRLVEAGVTPIRRDGNADVYDSQTALEAIYANAEADGLDGVQERARRDKEAADKLALENAKARGDLAPISIMEEEIASLMADMRTNALGMGAKLAPSLVGLTASQIQARIDAATYELLTEIANYEPGLPKA